MNVLVIRLSAMGDVAMTVPVIKAFSIRFPDDNIFFLTRKTFNPFFEGIDNVTLLNPDLKNRHNGVKGLYRLFREIKKDIKPDIIIDIHDVLRSKILRTFFHLSGINSYVIDKGRKEKALLTRAENKILKPLKHTVERYTDVFNKAGFVFHVEKVKTVQKLKLSDKASELLVKDGKNIGIAPFAMHIQKQYPLDKVKKLISHLTGKGYNIYVFGGGKKESEVAVQMENKISNVVSVIGKLSLKEEMAFISNLDLMISMDSANMHIAALTGIKIISIWGATHPYAGFTPFIDDSKSLIIQRDDLSCRPCSVFGNKPCYKDNMECFEISPALIAEECSRFL
ncbi:MAG: glycosyltransferase family 9 protein [Chlorobi bacterium]|nr:glycosyltransferase family 9 protein [Chlorobiota bacterium]